jgi:hypothetical protein
MPTYRIRALYEYEGEVEADNPKDAEKMFLDDLNSHYVSTEEYECDEVEMCEECDQPTDNGCVCGECDECGSSYDVSSRDGRCGDCGNCAECCDHNEEQE